MYFIQFFNETHIRTQLFNTVMTKFIHQYSLAFPEAKDELDLLSYLQWLSVIYNNNTFYINVTHKQT